ncbi:Outer membrane protein OmpA [Fulvimarina manganoxydans]|uniref:Outer membrane protein OmpA n=1 Tax=Fulvimarina manganoxydans TaxID=937218 RepID=A0A1W1ZP68_9HYPH|nr:OmpA family protein [Fulvimarina manganoxydans]SMC50186.1 Outer membrane protein OmpA [Fulvimarina manganoxydans]
MFVMKKAGRFAGLAALAASTALTGPGGALAQPSVVAGFQVAQANPDELPPPEAQAPAEEAPPPEAPAEAEPPVEQAPPPVEMDAAPEPEPAPAPDPEPAAEVAPEPAPAEEAAPPADEPASAPEPAEEPAPAPEAAAPAEEPVPAAEAPAEPEPAPAEDAAPQAEEPVPAAEEPAAPPAEAPADETAPIDEGPAGAAPDQSPEEELSEPAAADPAAETAPSAEDEPAPAADGAAEPTPSEPAPAVEEAPPAPSEPGPAEEAPVQAPDPTAPAGEPAAPEAAQDAEQAPGEPAPEALPQDGSETAAPTAPPADPSVPAEAAPAQEQAAEPAETPEPVAADIQTEPVPEDGLAASDARVQTLAEPITEIPSATSEQGQRIENQTIDNSTTNQTTNNTTVNNTTVNNTTVVRGPEPELPPGAEVVERVGDRDILSIVGAGLVGAVAGGAAAYFIRGDDTSRLSTNAEDQYYERLGGGRVRETIVRPNGVQVVTITNRYGETIQRSRIMPDGREMVLFYDPYADEGAEPRYYYDPGADLPPIDLTIPEDDYIVDIAEPDEALYYRTIVAPPVETVERIYSVDEVRRSKRIRDKVRRIDLSTINFAFGSDAIDQAEVGNLQALAEAISTVIDRNPSETFLVEGHTDAVGSDLANLALSDRRAEAVASALTDYFDIPPENLITQGYGEEFLKVNTDEPSAENRRVTVRRITPLVKPVQTSNR